MSTDYGYEVNVNRPDGPGTEKVRAFDAGLPPNPLPKASRRGRAGSAASSVATRLAAALAKPVEKEAEVIEQEVRSET